MRYLLFLLPLTLYGQLFQASTARREITPKEPVPMWGYGSRHDMLSEGVMDPLYAVALVLRTGDQKLAIVGMDLGRAPAEGSLQRIRQRVKQQTGIENSFIAGSHTHHGPVMELTDKEGRGKGRFDATIRYYAQMEDAVVEAIVEANSKLAPARMATGSVQLPGFNVNRHTKLEPKPSDRELAVLRIDGLDGKPIVILANFAAHPTTLPDKTMKFSADWVGQMKNWVGAQAGAPVMFMQGASGDQSVNREKGGYKEYGEAIGAEVWKLAQSLQPEDVEKPTLILKEERFPFKARVDLSNPMVHGMYAKAFFPELIANFEDEYVGGVQPRLTVALLNGDIALVGASGEFFSNHAIRLKERARVKQLFFFGYCNGYHQYFPTIEAVAEGGYGADPTVSPVAVGAGEQLMNMALVWIYQMLGRIRQ
ncbi:neutral/alkaline non-lysosomal ceramidase N-terminal domain-containing protein [uncultured Paludibaculum sp.]|uniref:neutral/alkaline non-lysosomal ceramidase N-terminal domain-containing protein n=1 Tax=uncultured Paludibaculum sp. TaxID=1765020 RepID=UPI002AAB9098|nr:neutral/alkaline non-lysosomal ceramidase N-terminal domain-containing protein [uncultured Paludibaculum sp.]